jgi:hypothetical protein
MKKKERLSKKYRIDMKGVRRNKNEVKRIMKEDDKERRRRRQKEKIKKKHRR